MTIFRVIKCENIKNGNGMARAIANFSDWSQLKERIKSKSHLNLLENLIPRIDRIEIQNERISVGNTESIDYNTLVSIPGAADNIWVKAQGSSIYFPHPSIIILQQPTRVFERLFKLALEYTLQESPKSPFTQTSLSNMVTTFTNNFNEKESEIMVNRIILQNTLFGTEEYQELNIKQSNMKMELINTLSTQSKNWKAFTMRVMRGTDDSLDSFSLRVDRYGGVLLYGVHNQERAKYVAQILADVADALS